MFKLIRLTKEDKGKVWIYPANIDNVKQVETSAASPNWPPAMVTRLETTTGYSVNVRESPDEINTLIAVAAMGTRVFTPSGIVNAEQASKAIWGLIDAGLELSGVQFEGTDAANEYVDFLELLQAEAKRRQTITEQTIETNNQL